jgi:hypothetical protein
MRKIASRLFSDFGLRHKDSEMKWNVEMNDLRGEQPFEKDMISSK